MATLSDGFPAPFDTSPLLRVALAHAVDFRTWYSLCVLGGLREEEAVELMLATVTAAVHLPASASRARSIRR